MAQHWHLNIWININSRFEIQTSFIPCIQLKDSGSGCHIGNHYVGSLGHADDTVLMAPSLKGLQTIVDVSVNYARNHDVFYNGRKSQFLIFPSNSGSQVKRRISIDENVLQNVSEAVHLGHHVSIINKDCMLQHAISQFCCSFKIFWADFGRFYPDIRCDLFIAYCLAFMMHHYATSVVSPSNSCVSHGGNVSVKYVMSQHYFRITNQWRSVFNQDFANSLWIYSKMAHQCWEPFSDCP